MNIIPTEESIIRDYGHYDEHVMKNKTLICLDFFMDELVESFEVFNKNSNANKLNGGGSKSKMGIGNERNINGNVASIRPKTSSNRLLQNVNKCMLIENKGSKFISYRKFIL